MRYTGYPPLGATVLLAVAIYVNFFAHHFVFDMRYVLFAATALIYLRTVVHYRVFRFRQRMPLLVGFLLVALFIWFAENVGTWSRVDLSQPGRQLDTGFHPEARRLVPADDHLVRAGYAGPPATAARGDERAPPLIMPCGCRA
jgi:hypothetical protein